MLLPYLQGQQDNLTLVVYHLRLMKTVAILMSRMCELDDSQVVVNGQEIFGQLPINME